MRAWWWVSVGGGAKPRGQCMIAALHSCTALSTELKQQHKASFHATHTIDAHGADYTHLRFQSSAVRTRSQSIGSLPCSFSTMVFAIGSTITGGIQDVSALLPLIGTEQ